MKLMRVPFSRLSLIYWGVKTLFQASVKDTFLIFVLFTIQGILPIASLFLMRKIILWLTNGSEVLIFPTLIALCWAFLLLFEKIFTPFVTILRVRLNEKVLAYFHLKLIQKANSFQGMQPFETGKLHEQIQYLENESSRRPMNFVYIFSDGISELITIITLLAFMVDISPIVGVAIFLSAIPHAVSTTWFERIRWNHTLFSGKYAKNLRWITSVSLKNETARELRIFDFGDFLIKKYRLYLEEFVSNFSKHCWKEILPALTLTLMTVIANTAIFCWTIVQASNSQLSIAGTIITLQAFILMQSRLTDILQECAMVQPVLDFFDQFKQFMSKKDDSLELSNATQEIGSLQHQIQFDNVSFIYPDGRVGVSNIYLTITIGETIALVGENGAGKSTLIKLLMRFYDPTSGNIYVDGVNLKEIRPFAWRQKISAVFQDYGKYLLTVEENIGLGKGVASYTKEQVVQALERGQFSKVVRKLTNGVHTQLGQELSGTGLSEGEWQKLAISRACMKEDAELLVLDEPSASLDPRSEHQLFESLAEFSKKKTVIFVTHRLGAVKMADRVIMMREGTIVEEGSHASLLHNPSQYAAYYSLQASHYDVP